MRSTLVLLLGSVATASPLLAESNPESAYSHCPSSTCKVQGYPGRTFEPYEVLTDSKWCSTEACGQRCAADKECKTFAVGEETCRLYGEDLYVVMKFRNTKVC